MNKMQEDQVFRELSALRIENQELKRLCDMDKVQRIQELEETIERMSEDAKGITVRAAGIFASPASGDCDACEGSGESVVNFPDGTEASTKTPPCEKCGGSGGNHDLSPIEEAK